MSWVLVQTDKYLLQSLQGFFKLCLQLYCQAQLFNSVMKKYFTEKNSIIRPFALIFNHVQPKKKSQM